MDQILTVVFPNQHAAATRLAANLTTPLLCAVLALGAVPVPARLPAQSSRERADRGMPDSAGVPRTGSAQWQAWLLGTQVNVITQHLERVRSPYRGPNSLPPDGDTQTSHAYGVYAGVQASARLQGYLDVEMIRGNGIAHATGLAGIPNGDVIRQGTVDLGQGPYVARAFMRYTLPAGGAERDTLTSGMDQVPAVVASRRLEIMVGKFAATDLFDVNRYANSTRWQFMNWALFNNTAWDYAADTRGYTNGVALSWIHPRWTLRVGSFQMPTQANGNVFDADLRRAHGDNAEVSFPIPPTHTVVRVLAYLNHARMGNYEEALARARATGPGTRPDIVADDRPGRTKYGGGLNVEQPLADSGETGVFARLGWSDGRNESFVYTEVDRHASAGIQLSGAHWRRSADRFAVAAFHHEIVRAHQQYLEAGGLGFLLGDGRLTYGPEQGIESYYRLQLGDFIQAGPDVQVIRNPGYNRDRGPATVVGVRVNLRY